MKDKIVRKNILLAVTVIMCGLLIAGGTFAYLTATATVNNGTYNTGSTCFVIDYTAGDQMTGTLFPSPNASEGLTGSVSMKISSSCTTLGKGTLYLNIKNTTNTKFDDVVAAHCENPNTLETIPNAKTSSACSSSGGSWVTNGTALKYAIYDSNTYTGTPLAKGYISNGMIGSETAIYTNFDVTHTLRNYYIAIWLDGYVSDNTYVDLAFSGHIRASASQVESAVPSGYQQVSYLQSSGTQYIDTQYIPNQNTRIYTRASTSGTSGHTGLFGCRTTDYTYPFLSYIENTYGEATNVVRIDAGGKAGSTGVIWSPNEPFSIDIDIPNSKVIVNDQTITRYTSLSYSTSCNLSMAIFAVHQGTSYIYPIVGKIYSFIIYESGAKVRHFIPCYRTSDSKPGMYDLINDVFYTNAATSGSDFTYG